jgi:hypothetical protein
MEKRLWLPIDSQKPDANRRVPVGVFLPVSIVFPGCLPSVAELKRQLSFLSRTDSLLWCARLNLVVSNATHTDVLSKQRFGVQQFFNSSEIRKIADFFGSSDNPETTLIFFRHQILELFQWIAAYCEDFRNDGTSFEDASVRQAFGKALLIAGEL